MSNWIDSADAYVGSQYPLSAMAMVDWIGGNLERLYDMSGWQIQLGFHEDAEGAQAISSADTWEIFSPLTQIPINIRPDRLAFRALKISAEIKTSAGATTVWRFFAVPTIRTPSDPDPTDGYYLGYTEISTSSGSYSWQTATLSAEDIAEAVRRVSAPDLSASAPTTEVPRVVIVALLSAKATGTGTMRGIHLEEVIA